MLWPAEASPSVVLPMPRKARLDESALAPSSVPASAPVAAPSTATAKAPTQSPAATRAEAPALRLPRGMRRASVLDDIPAPLADAYAASGGLIADDELAAVLGRSVDQPLSRLARWILNREVVCIPWQLQSVLPLFQFDQRDMSLRPEVVEVVSELAGALDDWDVALWFVTPNSWLDSATPVATIGTDPAAVLQAARADRFIARG